MIFIKLLIDHHLKMLKTNSLSDILVFMAATGRESNFFSCRSICTPRIIDPGASNHMTKLSYFLSYSPCFANKKVRIANGNFSGKGSVNIFEKITLKLVHNVPNLACNHISELNYLKILIVMLFWSAVDLLVYLLPMIRFLVIATTFLNLCSWSFKTRVIFFSLWGSKFKILRRQIEIGILRASKHHSLATILCSDCSKDFMNTWTWFSLLSI